ncbi:hypothetical protein ACHHYP_17146 [Achlya hypogyna]|uniref:Uncharacterized protein n=1 Tax=Achlya hypogyna TaxID=1202772 RepID=A0A1V9Y534_ACHHY|nr:hypothetical protein ACHHYP_17146 [Achlya hypogyna]
MHAELEATVAATKLRFSASRVASIVGLHEYGDAIEIFLEYVYQDLDDLLAVDARLLGLTLVSKDEELYNLMQKSGSASSLEGVVRWANKTSVANISTANDLASKVMTIAASACEAKKLSAAEAQRLQEGLREKLRTNVGKRNESLAIAAYEAQLGYVYSPHADFEALLRVQASNDAYYYILYPDPATATDAGCVCMRFANCAERVTKTKGDGRSLASTAHYFSLCGMVDGTTEVLRIDGEDDWRTELIVVEVKNRLHRFRDPVPLHDCVQMAVYMQMLGVSQGDLVQCLHDDRTAICVTRVVSSEPPLSSPACACACRRKSDLWSTVVVPRLYEYAAAIYTLRLQDLRRLAFLQAPPETQRAMLREMVSYDL